MSKPVLKSKYMERIEPRKEVVDWKIAAENSRKQLFELQKRYDILKMYSENIEKKNKDTSEQIRRLKEEELKKKNALRKELMKDNEIKTRDVIIKQMQFELKKQRDISRLYNTQIEKEQEFVAIKTSNRIPVIMINDFCRDDIIMAHKEYGIKNQVVCFRYFRKSNPAIRSLIDFKPMAVLNELDDDDVKELKKNGIMAVNIKPNNHSFYGSVSSHELEISLKETERKEFVKWLENYKSNKV